MRFASVQIDDGIVVVLSGCSVTGDGSWLQLGAVLTVVALIVTVAELDASGAAGAGGVSATL